MLLGDHLPAEGAGDPGVGVHPADVDLEPAPGHHLLAQVTLDSNYFRFSLFNLSFAWIVSFIHTQTHVIKLFVQTFLIFLR